MHFTNPQKKIRITFDVWMYVRVCLRRTVLYAEAMRLPDFPPKSLTKSSKDVRTFRNVF